jgi:Zn-dependent protease
MIKILLLLLSGAKFGKLLLSGGTMLISVVVYAFVFGWRYAVGFVALLLVHEMGHYLAAKQRGLKVGLPTFIPFVGAWIELKEQPHNAETEAYVGLGGPLLGTVGALVCYALARQTDTPWLLAVSYAGFFLNLFNLIPISPFDGGRITAVLSPRIWLLGVPVLGALFYFRPSPMLLIVALLAAPQLWKALTYRKDSEEAQTYYAIPVATKWEYGFYYLVLTAFLAVMTHDVHEMLQSSSVRHKAVHSVSDDAVHTQVSQPFDLVAVIDGVDQAAPAVLPNLLEQRMGHEFVVCDHGDALQAADQIRPT